MRIDFKREFVEISKACVFVSLVTCGLIGGLHTYSTQFQQNNSKLESIRKPTLNKTAGAVYIQDNKIYFRTFNDLLDKNPDIFDKKLKESSKIKNRFNNSTKPQPDISNGRGTGSCVRYKNINYILTNEHVIDGLSKKREAKLISNKELDISLIPFSELISHTISNLENCLNLSKTDEIYGKEYFFMGWGRDLYKSSGTIGKDVDSFNKEYDTFALSYREGSNNPYDETFVNNFPGTSGSTLVDLKGENVLGVFKSVRSFSTSDPISFSSYIYLPMNKTHGYFTSTNEIISWLDKREKKVNVEKSNSFSFSNLHQNLDEYLKIKK